MCNCKDKVKLQGLADDLNSIGSIDEIFPVNDQTGQRAMNINVQFDMKSAAILIAAILVSGFLLKKI